MLKTMSVSVLALVAANPLLAQATAIGEAQATAVSAPAPAPAPAPAQTMTDAQVDEIVVVAERVRGQVQTTAAPVVKLDEKQVAAYGASSIADLVAQLAPQVGAGRGRGGQPVILVNGQRITNFREMARFPPESIKNVEVLPEQVAVQFGYPPDQRVINFILKDNFASRDIEIEGGGPTRGGSASGEASASILTIDGGTRTNASVAYRASSPITEAERDILQTPGSAPALASDPDPAAFRTLTARTSSFEANATRTAGLGESGAGGQYTLNGNYARSNTRSLSGLDTVLLTAPGGAPVLRALDADPLARRTGTDSFSVGAGFNKTIGQGWRFATTLDASLATSQTDIDRRRDASALAAAVAAGTLSPVGALPVVNSAGYDVATSRTYRIESLTTLIGNRLLAVPAGDVSATLTGQVTANGITSKDTRSGLGEISLDRRRVRGGADISVPIASRRDDVLAVIGDLNVSFGGDLEHLSDFGTLTSWNLGSNWKPTSRLTLQTSYRVQQAAPTLSQLGNPVVTQFNVPIFDFTSGRTVLVTTTTGGNRDLRRQTDRDLKLSANYDLDLLDRANVVVEYYRNNSDDVTASFPLLTPVIEAAFPGRVSRAADGTLTALDARPVTFANQRSERIRYGFNIFGKLGKPLPPGTQGRSGFGAMFGGARPSGAPGATAAPAQAPAASAPAGQPGASGGAFDPQRFAEMRAKFCATPEGTVPDLTGVPPQMLDRLKDESGKIDPAKVAVMRQRFCSADAAQRFDPARFMAMRQALCADQGKDPDPATIPEEIRNRLKGPDGTIPPERLKEFRTRICAIPVPQAGGQSDGSGRPAGGGGGSGRSGGGGGFGPPGADGQGRWNVGLYHTVNLASTVTIAPGVPVLDLLHGDATGSSGGVARHQFELEGGGFYRGLGFRVQGNYVGPTEVDDLRFGSLATFNLRTFVALDQQKWLIGEDPGFLKNARLSLRLNNVFDARQTVTDQTGAVPLRYQPFLIDPVGRSFEIEFRKLF